jgi:hypothetical protein
MSNYSRFNILCIRNDSSSDDDVITIYPVKRFGSIHYCVEYEVAKSHRIIRKNINTIHKNFVTKDELKDYISVLIHMLNMDREPFIEYQIDLPNVPSVIIRQKDLLYTLHQINNYLEVLFKNWPMKYSKNEDHDSEDDSENECKENYCQKKSSHKYFDSDGETIYSEL